MKTTTTTALIFFVLFMACENDMTRRKMINPNGDSDLAILMRDMFDEGMHARQSIIRGETPEMKLNYHHINTATPSVEGKNTTMEYQLFAEAYNASVEQFKNANITDRPAAYQNMVDNCMSCHDAICKGPMVRIKKMYLSDVELNLMAKE